MTAYQNNIYLFGGVGEGEDNTLIYFENGILLPSELDIIKIR